MSRIDEALRRARRAADNPGGPTVSSVIDHDGTEQSMLEQYAAEKRSAPRAIVTERRASLAAAPKTAFRQLATFAPWLRDRVISSREIASVSSEQYRRLAAALHDL